MYIVITGGGKVGEYLARTLLKRGNQVAIIEQDAETADRLCEELTGPYLVICGDGCDSRYQEDAGIRKADVFVAATGQDDSNLVACEIAMRVFSIPRCVARVDDPRNMRIFNEIGVESVSATVLIANLIQEETMLGSVNAILSLTRDNVVLAEIPIPEMRNHSNERGLRAASIPMPPGSIIVAVSTEDDTDILDEKSVLFPGDAVVVAMERDLIDEVTELFANL